ncbi:lipopolysaccharide biosynthesis protein [Azohydromonas caseinilytica]|uniref:Oligosaccharide flippase family protein n=1 Tax=Azohydromonas caseinilytica TaxID=2728836 RepID=A0A848FA46_9BURK|nr:oligosaccharide flippase family protein [Azohydromonas caseinilytica]NML15080.1 oligosaccharide flippase family protein [Azohydromonas caseinilytica]
MSFRRNVIASYASQIYVTVIGIVIVPLYIRYMGVEAYGLVGFYAMLQAWFQLLDMGLSPTMARETARHAGGAVDGLTLRRLLRALEAFFLAIAAVGVLALVLGADWVASRWLNAQQLSTEQVRVAIQLMAGIVGLRWMAALYRSALGGFEQQVWLGALNASSATARFVLVIPVLMFVGTTPAHFFGHQLLVALVETALLARRTYRLLPPLPVGTPVGLHWHPLRERLHFSLSLAFTSAVWVGVTQSDKLLLSKLLPLSEYAHFSLAVLFASAVSILSGPLSSALLPRLSRLQAQGDEAGLLTLYRQATQGTAIVALPVALALCFGAEPLLRAWTGDAALAQQTATILRLYAAGNAALAIAAFAYYLQFAKGDVRLHLVGNLIFLTVLVPAIWLATLHYGAQGAGWAWLTINVVYLLLWVPLVHRRFAPGLHGSWLLRDVLLIALPPAVLTWLAERWVPWPHNPVAVGAMLAAAAMLLALLAMLASPHVRGFVKRQLQAA